jgi:hypothetical protein
MAPAPGQDSECGGRVPVAMTGSARPAIEVQDLRVRRGGREILRGLSLDIAAGRVTGLLGPSGSGKTTLLRAIVGVQSIESGNLRVLGAAAGAAAVRGKVGYMPQASGLYDDLSTLENLRYFSRILDTPRSRVEEPLATVRLEALADRVVGRSPAASWRARHSPSPSLVNRRCWFSTSRPSASIHCSAAPCGRCFAGSRAMGRRCSSRVTSWTRPATATSSCSYATARS